MLVTFIEKKPLCSQNISLYELAEIRNPELSHGFEIFYIFATNTRLVQNKI